MTDSFMIKKKKTGIKTGIKARIALMCGKVQHKDYHHNAGVGSFGIYPRFFAMITGRKLVLTQNSPAHGSAAVALVIFLSMMTSSRRVSVSSSNILMIIGSISSSRLRVEKIKIYLNIYILIW